MKTTDKKNLRIFKGAGFFIGMAIGMVAAVVLFAVTENIAVAIPPSAALGIPLGISLEQKFQAQTNNPDSIAKKAIFVITAFGVLLLSVLYFITKMN